MPIRTKGLALLDAAGAVIGAMDSMTYNLFTNESRPYRPRSQPRQRARQAADIEIEITNDERADAIAATFETRTPTMASSIKNYGRLK